MKVLNADRRLIYSILNAAYSSQGIKPKLMELGVLTGNNASTMFEVLAPEVMYLVDSWSCEPAVEYKRANAHRPWVDDPEKYAEYYGGPLSDQATFDRLYQKTVQLFSNKSNVQIVRASTRDAASQLKASGVANLDMIYVDANHQYETVFDDLLEYQHFLNEDNGCLQLNDCCHSELGMKQNLGVLEAAVKFCKLTNFTPVLLTNTDWTDILLARKNSLICQLIDQVVMMNDITFVELPAQLLGAMHVRYGQKRVNLSFI